MSEERKHCLCGRAFYSVKQLFVKLDTGSVTFRASFGLSLIVDTENVPGIVAKKICSYPNRSFDGRRKRMLLRYIHECITTLYLLCQRNDLQHLTVIAEAYTI